MPDDPGEGWRSFVDLERLAAWMDGQGLEHGPIEGPVRLKGGTQNVLLAFRRGARRFVLRRPPDSSYADGGATMRREARVLQALAGSAVPHPALIAACSDDAVLGAAFYLMAPVEGFCATQGLPALHAGDPAVRHAMGLSLVDALAALANTDYRAAGLGDFGKPEGFLERQVGRWLKQLDAYAKFPAWTGRADLPGIERLAAWLEANRPTAGAPGILHGDFHMGNALYVFDSPNVAALVDWEISTIGDPLVDLGGLLAIWADPDGRHPGCITVTPWTGFPTEAELVARYAARTGRDVAAVDWYVVLACFKLAIIQEGTNARASAGLADPALAAWLHTCTIALLERALARL
jgi:aminoglycoside phosphotransferase (APT) family kinase protein